jgi:hypothetical protein
LWLQAHTWLGFLLFNLQELQDNPSASSLLSAFLQ